MSSLRRTDANRINAQHSTGPRTSEGKSRASRNAVKHGLLAAQLVLSIEDRNDFETFRAGLIHEYQPVGTQELLLVTQIADNFWRLRRAKGIETAMFERYLDRESASPEQTLAQVWEQQSQEFERLRRYTAAFERAYYRAIATLRLIQKDRRREDERFDEPPAAAPVGFVSHSSRRPAAADVAAAPQPSPAQHPEPEGIESA